jgi:hemerythrin-like domain-containing protein
MRQRNMKAFLDPSGLDPAQARSQRAAKNHAVAQWVSPAGEQIMSMQLNEVTTSVPPSVAVAAEPFAALDACHQEVMGALQRFSDFLDHLDDHGVDQTAREQASALVAFFTQTARQHHADEEQQVFPSLLTSGDTELVQHVRRLQQDHGWLEEDWIELSPQLDAVSQGYSWYDIDALRHGVSVFTALYHDHIDLEESLIYPEAKRRMAALPDAGSGRDQSQARRQAST